MGADRKRVLRPVAVAVGAPDIGRLKMPETCLPIRTTGVRPLPALVLSVDQRGPWRLQRRRFRPHPRRTSATTTCIAGSAPRSTGSVGLHASQFQLTENERQLRDLAYPLIEPPHSRPAWKSVFGDYQPLPSPWRQKVVFDRTAYGRALIDEPHRSHTSRYSAIDRGRARRHHPVRAVLRLGDRASSNSTASATPASSWCRSCRRANATMRSPAWKRTR